MAAPQRITIITGSGSTVSGPSVGPVGRAGSIATVATPKGPVKGQLVPAGGQPPQRRSPRGNSRSLASGIHPSLASTSILPESADVRFLDGAIGLAIGVGSSLFVASRPTAGQRLGWGAFLTGLGTLAFVEGRGGVLKYGGAYTAAANGAVLGLELFGLTKQGL